MASPSSQTTVFTWISFFAKTISGYFVRAWQEAKKQNMTIDTLVSVGLLGGGLWSLYAFLVSEETYLSCMLLSVIILCAGAWIEKRFSFKKDHSDSSIQGRRMINYMDAVFVPASIFLASVTLIICAFVLSSSEDATRRALMILFVTIPCALGANRHSVFHPERGWAFFYALLGIPFALFGATSPLVINFFLLCSGLTIFTNVLRRGSAAVMRE